MDNDGTPEHAGLDAAIDHILDRFDESRKLDFSHEIIHKALNEKFRERGYDERLARLLEVNLLGSLSGWISFVLEEKLKGRDAIPDFANTLKQSYLFHCRENGVEVNVAINLAVELASAIMDVAANYRRHMGLEEGGVPFPEEDTIPGKTKEETKKIVRLAV